MTNLKTKALMGSILFVLLATTSGILAMLIDSSVKQLLGMASVFGLGSIGLFFIGLVLSDEAKTTVKNNTKKVG